MNRLAISGSLQSNSRLHIALNQSLLAGGEPEQVTCLGVTDSTDSNEHTGCWLLAASRQQLSASSYLQNGDQFFVR